MQGYYSTTADITPYTNHRTTFVRVLTSPTDMPRNEVSLRLGAPLAKLLKETMLIQIFHTIFLET